MVIDKTEKVSIGYNNEIRCPYCEGKHLHRYCIMINDNMRRLSGATETTAIKGYCTRIKTHESMETDNQYGNDRLEIQLWCEDCGSGINPTVQRIENVDFLEPRPLNFMKLRIEESTDGLIIKWINLNFNNE